MSLEKRIQIADSLKSEREYQKRVWSEGEVNPKSKVYDHVNILSWYIDLTRKAFVENPGDHQALHFIRKVAGIALRYLEMEPSNSLTLFNNSTVINPVSYFVFELDRIITSFRVVSQGYSYEELFKEILSVCIYCFFIHGCPSR